MNCRECQRLFEEVISGKAERPAVEAHLHECASCAKAFAEERKLWELLGRAKVIQTSFGFADRVARQLDERPQRVAGWRVLGTGWMRWGFATAALSVVISVSALAWYRHQEQERFVKQFEDLFAMVQKVDPESVVIVDTQANGDAP